MPIKGGKEFKRFKVQGSRFKGFKVQGSKFKVQKVQDSENIEKLEKDENFIKYE